MHRDMNNLVKLLNQISLYGNKILIFNFNRQNHPNPFFLTEIVMSSHLIENINFFCQQTQITVKFWLKKQQTSAPNISLLLPLENIE